MQLTQKTRAAAQTLQRRYLQERRDLRRTGNYQPLDCRVKLDRLVFTAAVLLIQELRNIPGYRAQKPQQLWKQLYGIVTRIRGIGSIRKVVVESAPNARWLPRYRITIIPRDETGLLFDDLRLIFELIPHFTIVLVEIAFDFPIRSFIDPSYVRRHALFGRTWLRVGTDELHERCGSAGSSKVVRYYVKFEASTFRIELQLNARFLRQHRINHTSDFGKLATILPSRHIHFASLDDAKLRKHLLRSGLSHEKRDEIVKDVAARKQSLWGALRYLRQNAKLTNVRRLLVPLISMNTLVTNALVGWARQWSSAPNRLNSPAREPEKVGLSANVKLQTSISPREGKL